MREDSKTTSLIGQSNLYVYLVKRGRASGAATGSRP